MQADQIAPIAVEGTMAENVAMTSASPAMSAHVSVATNQLRLPLHMAKRMTTLFRSCFVRRHRKSFWMKM